MRKEGKEGGREGGRGGGKNVVMDGIRRNAAGAWRTSRVLVFWRMYRTEKGKRKEEEGVGKRGRREDELRQKIEEKEVEEEGRRERGGR